MKIPLILMVLFLFVPSIEAFEARNHSSDDGSISCKVFPTLWIEYIPIVKNQLFYGNILGELFETFIIIRDVMTGIMFVVITAGNGAGPIQYHSARSWAMKK